MITESIHLLTTRYNNPGVPLLLEPHLLEPHAPYAESPKQAAGGCAIAAHLFCQYGIAGPSYR